MRITARLAGASELSSALDELEAAFRVEVVDTIATGAAIIESEAKGRAPYDEGDLVGSIGTQTEPDGMRAMIGSDEEHARFTEFGTIYASAQPWLFPSYRLGARYVRKRMREWGAGVGRKMRFKTKRARR